MSNLSVVVASYRAEATIARTIESLLGQQDVIREIIVVVDGGTIDRTEEIARSYSRTSVIVNPRRFGAAASRNVGLCAVSGSVVTFVDADDYVEGEFHQGMVNALDRSKVDMVVCPHVEEFEGPRRRVPGRSVSVIAEAIPTPDMAMLRFLQTGLLTGAMGWRTASLRSIGGWNPSSFRCDDMELVMRSLASGLTLATGSGGHYVHTNDAPDRMGAMLISVAAPALRLYLGVVENHAQTSPLKTELLDCLARKYYRLARYCFGEGGHLAAREMLAHARRLGLRGHPGTMLHRLGCGILGLRNKQQLAARLTARMRLWHRPDVKRAARVATSATR